MTGKQLQLLVCLTLCGLYASAESAPYQLSIDPFDRPQAGTITSTKTPVSHTLDKRLTATMRSGSLSLVNLEGELLEKGESIDGFRLMDVRERSATFVKDGKRFTLNIDEEDNDFDKPATD